MPVATRRFADLRHKLAQYDRYGEHRTNGLKAVFVLELLFFFNYIYTVPNPYFYYFYVPLTAFAAEVAGSGLREKYRLFFYTVMGSTLAIFLFGIFASYPTFFVFFVFFYSLWIYFTALYRLKSMLVPAPLILSLAAYSLIYSDTNANFYIALNHALQTIVAMVVVFIGLWLFPKHYYLAIWRRAFGEALLNLSELSAAIARQELKHVPVVGATIVMERYARMLSPKMRYFSVLKITLLTLDLVMAMSYLVTFQQQIRQQYVQVLHNYLQRLEKARRQRLPLILTAQERAVFHETYELRTLYQLILSWNHLCCT